MQATIKGPPRIAEWLWQRGIVHSSMIVDSGNIDMLEWWKSKGILPNF